MAKSGEDRYYKRTGDRFAKMEHYEVADMFSHRSRPKLDLKGRPVKWSTSEGANGRVYKGKLVLYIVNSGRGSARAPFLGVMLQKDWQFSDYGLDGNGNEGLRRLVVAPGSGWRRFGGMGDIMIHPGTTYDVSAIDLRVRADERNVKDVSVEYELAAYNFPLTRGELIIKGEDILRALVQGG